MFRLMLFLFAFLSLSFVITSLERNVLKSQINANQGIIAPGNTYIIPKSFSGNVAIVYNCKSKTTQTGKVFGIDTNGICLSNNAFNQSDNRLMDLYIYGNDTLIRLYDILANKGSGSIDSNQNYIIENVLGSKVVHDKNLTIEYAIEYFFVGKIGYYNRQEQLIFFDSISSFIDRVRP